MWIQIQRVTGPSDRVGQGTGAFEANALPVLQKQKGFLGVALVANRSSGEGAAVLYWQDEHTAEAAEQQIGHMRKQGLAQQGMSEGETVGGELVLIDSKDPNREPRPGTFLRSNDTTLDPSKLDQLIGLMRDKVVPELHKQPGYINANMIVNRKTGRSVISSNWDSAEHRKASNAAISELRHEAEAIAGSNVKVEEWETFLVHIPKAALGQGR